MYFINNKEDSNMNFKLLRIKKEKQIIIFLCVIFLLLLTYIFFPLKGNNINNFERIISNASINNFDANKLVRKFIFFNLVLIPTFTFLFYKAISKLEVFISDSTIDFKNNFRFLSVLILLNMVLLNANKYDKNSSYLFPSIFLGIFILFICVIYCVFYKSKVSEDTFKWILLFSINFIFVLQIAKIIPNIEIQKQSSIINTSFILMSLISSSLFCFISILLLFVVSNCNSIDIEILKKNGNHVFLYPFCIWFFSEFFLIMNQNNIIISFNRRLFFLGIFVIMILIWVIKYKYRCFSKEWVSRACSYFIISLIFISKTIPQKFVAYTDLFEQANIGVSTSNFLQFSKLPLIETHGAHMLSDYIFNIIYGLFNNDYYGALFSPYSILKESLGIILLFFILKKVIGPFNSFLIFMFLPFFFLDGSLFITGISLMSFIFYIWLYERPNKILFYYIYWFGLFLSLIYQGDFGLAFGLATIILVIIDILKKESRIDYKKYTISFVITSLSISIIFSLLCISRKINPIDKIYEFFNIMLKSNQNWASPSLGDSTKFYYYLTYSIIPLTTIFLIFLMLKNKKQNSKDVKYKIVICIGLSYIINLPRILGRHSAAEGWIIARNIIAVLFISLFCYIFFKSILKFSITLFLLSSTLILIEFGGIAGTTQFNVMSANFNYSYLDNFFNVPNSKMQRCTISNDMKRSFVYIVDEINNLLDEDETYLDFTNQSLLYSLSKRLNPVYVNQTPGMVSGDFSQDMYIKQIKNSDFDVPIALLPANNNIFFALNLDNVMNSYRYYKISEFIYKEYEPFEVVGDYAIWCKKGKKEYFTNKSKFNYSKNNFQNILKKVNAVEGMDINILSNYPNITVHGGHSDPSIVNLEKYIDFSKVSDSDTLYKLTLYYKSNINGFCELFYTNNEVNTHFDCESLKFNCSLQGRVEFILPLSKISNLRLDIPNNSIFTIQNINLEKKNEDVFNYSYAKNIEYVDNYDYGDASVLHVYNLKFLPYIWGEYDYKKSYLNKNIDIIDITKESNLNKISFNLSKINLNEGVYLYLVFDSNVDDEISLDFKENNIEKCKFIFNIKKGNYKYIIRLTSDYAFYTNSIDTLSINLKEDMKIRELQLKEGD